MCFFEGCSRPRGTRGMCSTHYKRWLRHGDPAITHPFVYEGRPLRERFWEKVERDGPVPEYAPHLGACWLWTASCDKYGYGRIWVNEDRRREPAHRVAYELVIGPIPGGLHLDHLCRVRLCVNPAHVEPVTNAENVRRGHRARQSGVLVPERESR